jgi:ligand-binding SRPBCC domain-containing protein
MASDCDVVAASAFMQDDSMPVEVEFTSVLEAPPDVVWDRVVRVTGANDELWPFARMTAPSFADRLTGPGNGRLPPFRSWFLLFGVVPIDRRTIQFEALDEGRMIESSSSRFNGNWRHERTAIAGARGSTVLRDSLVIESRGKLADSFTRASLTYMFRRRHRRLRRHFSRVADRTPAVGPP